jgi:ribosomal protein S15P/S13E
MLIKKAVAVRKHLGGNRKDRDSKLYVSQCRNVCFLFSVLI